MDPSPASGSGRPPNPAEDAGSDSTGRQFASREDMWREELRDGTAFYDKAITYWSAIPATVDGVLGGYGKVSPVDVRDSEAFLTALYGAELREGQAGKRRLVAAGERRIRERAAALAPWPAAAAAPNFADASLVTAGSNSSPAPDLERAHELSFYARPGAKPIEACPRSLAQTVAPAWGA